jgi:hypothetical protein
MTELNCECGCDKVINTISDQYNKLLDLLHEERKKCWDMEKTYCRQQLLVDHAAKHAVRACRDSFKLEKENQLLKARIHKLRGLRVINKSAVCNALRSLKKKNVVAERPAKKKVAKPLLQRILRKTDRSKNKKK